MTEEKFNAVDGMIWHELNRGSLEDLCEIYGVTCEDVERYMDLALERFEQIE